MSKSRDAFRTISEVSTALDTPAHVLRFWESKFSQVKPVKRAGGRRYYRPGDLNLLAGIKRLLHDDGMTIKGAQKLLREKGVKHVTALGAETLEGSVDMVSTPDADTTAPATPEDQPTAATPVAEATPEGEAPKTETAPTEPQPAKAIETPPQDLFAVLAEKTAAAEPQHTPDTTPAPVSEAAPDAEPEPETETATESEPASEPEAQIDITNIVALPRTPTKVTNDGPALTLNLSGAQPETPSEAEPSEPEPSEPAAATLPAEETPAQPKLTLPDVPADPSDNDSKASARVFHLLQNTAPSGLHARRDQIAPLLARLQDLRDRVGA